MLIDLESRYGVKIIGICPEQTNPKPHNMAACGSEAQTRVFSYFRNVVDVAAAVGANQVVVTSGWAFLDESIDAAYERSVDMLRRVAGYAEARDIPLAIEALQKRESVLANTAEDLKRLIDDVGSPALKVCLDTGAMARAGDSIEAYFNLFADDIIHAHFVDVDENSTHKAWGDGRRDMAEDLGAMVQGGYHGYLSVETTSSMYFDRPSTADVRAMRSYRDAIEHLQEWRNKDGKLKESESDAAEGGK